MTKFFVVAAFMLSSIKPAWQHNLETAKIQAQKEHKLILLNFSGSDWCIPCIRLHNEVFNADVFAKYANDNLVLLNADFPRKKKNKLSPDQQKINDALAERYNPKGSFPFTILLDENGNKIKIWDGFYKDGAANLVSEIKEASLKK